MDLHEALIESLDRLGTRCLEPPGKLAYLLLTSKGEAPLRDALAWELHGVVSGDSETGVAREWRAATAKRIDIAVLGRGRPISLVEAKLAYAAEMIDGERPNTDLCRRVQKDIDKLRGPAVAEYGCPKFVIVFLVYNDRVPQAAQGVLREYGQGRKRLVDGPEKHLSDFACAGHYGEDEIRNGFSCYLAEWGNPPVAHSGTFSAGETFCTAVSVYYWLLEVPVA